MLNKRLLVAISLFIATLIVLEILSCIFTVWSTIYSFGAKSAVCVFVTGFLLDLFGQHILKSKLNPKGKAVFITGCDSGFGYLLAKRLDSEGYKVFAGCLFPAKGGALELQNTCSQQLQTVLLDITKDNSVQNARNFVQSNLENCELWAIVNNAGIFRGLDVEFCPIDHFKACLEVNTIGTVRVTKAFLPLLRQSKGRVVNVNSQAGRFSVPYFAAYCMSKHASVCFTECLKQEMKYWGVRVISVEPEFFQTSIQNKEIVGKTLEEASNEISDDVRRDYGDDYLEYSNKAIENIFNHSSLNTDLVINDLETAISAEYPTSVYKPCRNWFVSMLMYLGRQQPKEIIYASLRLLLRQHTKIQPNKKGL